MKKKYNKKQKKSLIIKLLNIIGAFLSIGATFLIILSRKYDRYLDIGTVFLFFGIILLIPDSWIFIRDKRYIERGLDIYWLSKFLALPIVLVLLIVYFFIKLFS